jgi:hypothetical protein
LRGERQYAPASKNPPIIKTTPPMPPADLVIERTRAPQKEALPPGREFKLATPKKSYESVRAPQGNPREEQENAPFESREKKEEEGKGKADEPKKSMGREHALPMHMVKECAWYDMQDDDVVMEDELLEKAKVRRQQEKEKRKDIPKDGDVAHKAMDRLIEARLGSRRSEIADGTSPRSILNQILNVPVALTTGEVLGVSKELLGLLAELIRPRAVVRKGMYVGHGPNLGNKNSANGFRITGIPEARMKEALIELLIKISGNSLKAVIDTGSQLNIVSERMYEKIIKLPIKWNETLTLHDANGGRGCLRGLVSQVPINIEAVLTTAEIYKRSSI